MKRLIFVTLLATIAALGLLVPSHASARYAAVIIDAKTGAVLHAENPDKKNYPASLTKMMTLYMVFEALRDGRLSLNQKLPVSRRAAAQAPSKLGLAPGSTITVREAIGALVTKSANDVASVVAEALGDSETGFARQMTLKARKLGMEDTTFRNASGLPNQGQRSTALDMAKLAVALLRDFPREYSYFSQKSFAFRGNTYTNHNHLLGRVDGVDGIKTGFIQASGFNTVVSAKRDGHRLIAVMFGGDTARARDKHVSQLLERSFVQIAKGDIGTQRVQTAAAPAGGLISPAQAATTEDGDKASIGPWSVQVGAFSRQDAAQRAANHVARTIPSLTDNAVNIVRERTRKAGVLYKARLIGMTEPEARQACQTLKNRKMDCLVVRTEMGSNDG